MTNLLKSGLSSALIALLISGCGPKTSPGQNFYAERGTVDGGGGAGFQGKPLESYHNPLEKLPEYQHFVVPVLDALGKLNPDYKNLFLHIVEDRSWRFMGVPIPKLSEARQGVVVSIDQWGAQNSHEIWLSDKYAGKEEYLGTILLHEILVGLKIMRFLSYNEYCNVWHAPGARCPEDGNQVLIAEYKLDDQDHEDVRNMGDWLWDHYKTMTAEQFADQMLHYQFQSPHYGWKEGAALPMREQDDRDMSGNLERLMGKTVDLYTGYGYDSVATQKCQITFDQRNNGRWKIHARVVDLKTGDTKKQVDYDVVYKLDSIKKVGPVGSAFVHQYAVMLDDGRPLNKVGDLQKDIHLTFDHDDALVEVFGSEAMVDTVENGSPGSKGNTDGPSGIFCSGYAVDQPWNFGIWQTMRAKDRDFLERDYYHGKTYNEMVLEVDKLPVFQHRLFPGMP